MVVDYDGRIISQASPGPGERIVVGPVNVDMLRHERRVRRAHQMMAHLRTECYPLYQQSYLASATLTNHEVLTVTDQERRIDAVKEKIGYLVKEESSSLLSIQRLIDLSKEKGAD